MKITKNTAQWDKIKANLLKNIPSIQTGWFEGQNYGSDNDNLPFATVAQWDNEGHRNDNGSVTPPRPFMSMGLAGALQAGANKDDFKDMIQVVASGNSVMTVLNKAGTNFERTLRKVMLDWDTPRNAPLTIALKGFDDPLVETSELIANVNSRIST
jgi:hypothetical protein